MLRSGERPRLHEVEMVQQQHEGIEAIPRHVLQAQGQGKAPPSERSVRIRAEG